MSFMSLHPRVKSICSQVHVLVWLSNSKQEALAMRLIAVACDCFLTSPSVRFPFSCL